MDVVSSSEILYMGISSIVGAGGAWAVLRTRVNRNEKDIEELKDAHGMLYVAVQSDRVDIAGRLGRIEQKLDSIIENKR